MNVGKFGLGTATPGATFECNGILRCSGWDNVTTGAGVLMAYSGGIGYITSFNNDGGYYTSLFLNAAELFINNSSGGYVCIAKGAPGYQLDVGGDINSDGVLRQKGVALSLRLGRTFALVGDVSAITALPSIFVTLTGAQASTLYGLRAKIGSGTSIGVQVMRNGAPVGSVITVTPTVSTVTLGNLALADNDELTLILSAPVGTPSNFSGTLILDQTP